MKLLGGRGKQKRQVSEKKTGRRPTKRSTDSDKGGEENEGAQKSEKSINVWGDRNQPEVSCRVTRFLKRPGSGQKDANACFRKKKKYNDILGWGERKAKDERGSTGEVKRENS